MTAVMLAGWAAAVICAGVALIDRRALRTRMERVARASHELRGPLTAVRLGLSLSSRAGTLSAAHAAALEGELGRADLALEDLAAAHEWRPRGAPIFHLTQVRLDELLAEVACGAEGRAQRCGAAVTAAWVGSHALVWADRRRLGQALANLVSNAIEHGGRQVTVSGGIWGDVARLEVHDDGPGLPATVTDLAARPSGGRGRRGRGLAIARDAVQAHGGSIAGAPTGHGARVVVMLPTHTG